MDKPFVAVLPWGEVRCRCAGTAARLAAAFGGQVVDLRLETRPVEPPAPLKWADAA